MLEIFIPNALFCFCILKHIIWYQDHSNLLTVSNCMQKRIKHGKISNLAPILNITKIKHFPKFDLGLICFGGSRHPYEGFGTKICLLYQIAGSMSIPKVLGYLPVGRSWLAMTVSWLAMTVSWLAMTISWWSVSDNKINIFNKVYVSMWGSSWQTIDSLCWLSNYTWTKSLVDVRQNRIDI